MGCVVQEPLWSSWGHPNGVTGGTPTPDPAFLGPRGLWKNPITVLPPSSGSNVSSGVSTDQTAFRGLLQSGKYLQHTAAGLQHFHAVNSFSQKLQTYEEVFFLTVWESCRLQYFLYCIFLYKTDNCKTDDYINPSIS